MAPPTEAPAPPAPTPPADSRRELPTDPAARDAARLSVRSEADTIIGALSIVGVMLPPKRPLSEEEVGMVRPPLEDTLYRYGGNVDPAVSLTLAILAIAGLRFLEWKASQPKEGAGPDGFAPPKADT